MRDRQTDRDRNRQKQADRQSPVVVRRSVFKTAVQQSLLSLSDTMTGMLLDSITTPTSWVS